MRSPKQVHEVVALAPSSARAASGNTQSDPKRLPELVAAIGFVLDVTAAGTVAGDTLDVFVQTKADGANWLDVVHFTQVVGNGGAKRYVAKIAADVAQTEFDNATALSAAAVRNILGDEWALRWVVVDGGGTHSFTFSCTAVPM